MKTKLSLFLALCLILGCLSGCGAAQSPSEPTETEAMVQGVTEPSEPAPADATGPELFYDYLASTVIPQVGLANMAPLSVDTNNFDTEHVALLQEKGFLGLASAAVRDFDGDGTEEMVTVTLEASEQFHTWIREFIREDMWLISTINVRLDLYTIENGQVVLKATEPCLTYIDGLSWGPIAVGLELYEGVIYIWGKNHSENASTYGNSPFCICHVENGAFVRDYVDGMTWGQEDLTEEFSEVTTSHMIIRNTPLMDVRNAVGKIPSDADSWPETFGARLLTQVLLSSDWDAWGQLNAQGTDYTGLNEILSGEAFETPELPTEPLSQPGGDLSQTALDFAQPFASEISSVNNWEMEGLFHSEITLFSGSTLRLSYDMESGKLTQILLNSDGTPASESWYREKDLLLNHPDLALDADAVAPMQGKCSMTEFSSGVNAGSCTVTILEVMSAVLNIQPN